MTDIGSVGVVGLGLIGGSLARDLAARGVRVRAWDCDPESLRAAIEAGVVESALDAALDDLSGLDAVVLAVPVTDACDVLTAAADRLASVPLITDVCSTKCTIASAAADAGLTSFIGSHPLAGDHHSGWAASRTGLFRSATVYICPDALTPAEPLTLLHQLWAGLDARTELIDAAGHDRLLAFTSHMPQATATALARVLASAGIPSDRLGPGGRDMTRLAGSSPDVWAPIALDNATALCEALAGLEAELAMLRRGLQAADRRIVRNFFDGPHRS